jgi:hypothetical protein
MMLSTTGSSLRIYGYPAVVPTGTLKGITDGAGWYLFNQS